MEDHPRVSMAVTTGNSTSTMEDRLAMAVVIPGEVEVIEEGDTVAHLATDGTTTLPGTLVVATVVIRST